MKDMLKEKIVAHKVEAKIRGRLINTIYLRAWSLSVKEEDKAGSVKDFKFPSNINDGINGFYYHKEEDQWYLGWIEWK